VKFKTLKDFKLSFMEKYNAFLTGVLLNTTLNFIKLKTAMRNLKNIKFHNIFNISKGSWEFMKFPLM
jgi:hypothetical protein